jgi:hypothetical protein
MAIYRLKKGMSLQTHPLCCIEALKGQGKEVKLARRNVIPPLAASPL